MDHGPHRPHRPHDRPRDLNDPPQDLLFDALATTPGRHLVHQLDPLPMPPGGDKTD